MSKNQSQYFLLGMQYERNKSNLADNVQMLQDGVYQEFLDEVGLVHHKELHQKHLMKSHVEMEDHVQRQSKLPNDTLIWMRMAVLHLVMSLKMDLLEKKQEA